MRFVWVVFALSACVAEPPSSVPDAESHVTYFDLPVAARPAVDMLVVIDNSPAMEPYRANVTAQHADYLDLIEGYDLHLGVITSDLGALNSECTSDDGLLVKPTMASAPFLAEHRDYAGGLSKNYAGTLEAAFAEIANVGTTGCYLQHPLAAVHRALTNPANAGFRRSHAWLIVVVIAARDDASSGYVHQYSGFLTSVTDEDRRVYVIGNYPGPLPRLDAFLEELPHHYRGIDQPGLAGPHVLRDHGFLVCVEETLLDVDPEQPGDQLDCSVAEKVRDGSDWISEQVLPACDPIASRRPCWRFEQDLQYCPFGAGRRLEVERWAEPTREAHVIGYCAVDASDR